MNPVSVRLSELPKQLTFTTLQKLDVLVVELNNQTYSSVADLDHQIREYLNWVIISTPAGVYDQLRKAVESFDYESPPGSIQLAKDKLIAFHEELRAYYFATHKEQDAAHIQEVTAAYEEAHRGDVPEVRETATDAYLNAVKKVHQYKLRHLQNPTPSPHHTVSSYTPQQIEAIETDFAHQLEENGIPKGQVSVIVGKLHTQLQTHPAKALSEVLFLEVQEAQELIGRPLKLSPPAGLISSEASSPPPSPIILPAAESPNIRSTPPSESSPPPPPPSLSPLIPTIATLVKTLNLPDTVSQISHNIINANPQISLSEFETQLQTQIPSLSPQQIQSLGHALEIGSVYLQTNHPAIVTPPQIPPSRNDILVTAVAAPAVTAAALAAEQAALSSTQITLLISELGSLLIQNPSQSSSALVSQLQTNHPNIPLPTLTSIATTARASASLASESMFTASRAAAHTAVAAIFSSLKLTSNQQQAIQASLDQFLILNPIPTTEEIKQHLQTSADIGLSSSVAAVVAKTAADTIHQTSISSPVLTPPPPEPLLHTALKISFSAAGVSPPSSEALTAISQVFNQNPSAVFDSLHSTLPSSSPASVSRQIVSGVYYSAVLSSVGVAHHHQTKIISALNSSSAIFRPQQIQSLLSPYQLSSDVEISNSLYQIASIFSSTTPQAAQAQAALTAFLSLSSVIPQPDPSSPVYQQSLLSVKQVLSQLEPESALAQAYTAISPLLVAQLSVSPEVALTAVAGLFQQATSSSIHPTTTTSSIELLSHFAPVLVVARPNLNHLHQTIYSTLTNDRIDPQLATQISSELVVYHLLYPNADFSQIEQFVSSRLSTLGLPGYSSSRLAQMLASTNTHAAGKEVLLQSLSLQFQSLGLPSGLSANLAQRSLTLVELSYYLSSFTANSNLTSKEIFNRLFPSIANQLAQYSDLPPAFKALLSDPRNPLSSQLVFDTLQSIYGPPQGYYPRYNFPQIEGDLSGLFTTLNSLADPALRQALQPVFAQFSQSALGKQVLSTSWGRKIFSPYLGISLASRAITSTQLRSAQLFARLGRQTLIGQHTKIHALNRIGRYGSAFGSKFRRQAAARAATKKFAGTTVGKIAAKLGFTGGPLGILAGIALSPIIDRLLSPFFKFIKNVIGPAIAFLAGGFLLGGGAAPAFVISGLGTMGAANAVKGIIDSQTAINKSSVLKEKIQEIIDKFSEEGSLVKAAYGTSAILIIPLLVIICFVVITNSSYMVPLSSSLNLSTPSDCIDNNYPKPSSSNELRSSNGRYVFPMSPFYKNGNQYNLWYSCIHWNTQINATDIGVAGDTRVNPQPGNRLPILAYTSGRIEYVSLNDPLGGKNIILAGSDGHYYYYAHNCAVYVHQGQSVQAGEVIAVSDNTGSAANTVEHLHFAINRFSPDFVANSGGGDYCVSRDFKDKFGLTACDNVLNCYP